MTPGIAATDEQRTRRRPLGCEAALMEAQRRVELLDGELRSFITWMGATALDQARDHDAAASRGEWRGPLAGVLVAVKDNIATSGVRTTSGSRLFEHFVPRQDATVVRRLQRAGAVLVGKCNMAELAWGATTQNVAFGSCRNAWDPRRIPGGSSGGSGVAVAAGFCQMALGTDTGASTRIPASVNGVVGLRPTLGRISNAGITPVSPSQDTVGPMAQTVADVARLTAVLSGWDPEDPFSLRPDGPSPVEGLLGSADGLRIGVVEGYFTEGLNVGVAQCFTEASRLLEQLGARLTKMEVPGAEEAGEHWTRIVSAEGAAVHRADIETRPDMFSPDVLARISEGLSGSRAELAESLLWRANYRTTLMRLLGEVDLLVAPTIGTDVPFIEGYDSRGQTRELGRLTYPWALHRGPTMSLPVGFHPDSGMPVGLAIVAAPWQEATAVRAGADYQRHTEWHRIEPTYVKKVLSTRQTPVRDSEQ
jgi:aspartyl-tRNA(Asn)/glutamyl-tRNA(Gln) amidotransferase subunit A